MKDYTKLTLSDFAIKVEGNRKEIEQFYERMGLDYLKSTETGLMQKVSDKLFAFVENTSALKITPPRSTHLGGCQYVRVSVYHRSATRRPELAY